MLELMLDLTFRFLPYWAAAVVAGLALVFVGPYWVAGWVTLLFCAFSAAFRWFWVPVAGRVLVGLLGVAGANARGWAQWLSAMLNFLAVGVVGILPYRFLLAVVALSDGAEGASSTVAMAYGAGLAVQCLALFWWLREFEKGWDEETAEMAKNSVFDKATGDTAALAAFVDPTGGQVPAGAALAPIDPEALAEAVREDVIGQDAIVGDVCALLARRIRQGRPKRPLGVVLFVGATGSGKTELAKALAAGAFEGRLARVDCNELTEQHSAQRLIGAPPGYIGSEQGGQLTRDITRLGSGVILFDEIEKAHEAVIRIIMGLMDEGRLTEQSTGNVADAQQFLIVLTSNAEHAALAEIVETIEDPNERRRAVKDTLAGVFKPEQLARIDEIYCFGQLDRRAMVEVVGKFLMGFAADARVELVGVDSRLLVETVLRHERGAKYGIRELVRLVEKAIMDGMLDRRDEGFKRVEIVCEGERIEVRGVPDQGDDNSAARGGATRRASA